MPERIKTGTLLGTFEDDGTEERRPIHSDSDLETRKRSTQDLLYDPFATFQTRAKQCNSEVRSKKDTRETAARPGSKVTEGTCIIRGVCGSIQCAIIF